MDTHVADLIRNVMYYVINYEIETGEKFSEAYWHDVNFTPFAYWVSSLRQTGLIDIIWIIKYRIQEIRKIYTSKDMGKLRNRIRELRNRFDFYSKHGQWGNDESDFYEPYVTLEVELEVLQKLEPIWTKEKEIETNRSKKNFEYIMNNLTRVGHGPMKIIGSMIGSTGNVEFDDYKVEPTYAEALEQQFLSHIPNLARRGITFEQFLSNPHVDPEAYELFIQMPDLYQERARSAFLSVDEALEQLKMLVPSLYKQNISYDEFVSNPRIHGYWLFQFIKGDPDREWRFRDYYVEYFADQRHQMVYDAPRFLNPFYRHDFQGDPEW